MVFLAQKCSGEDKDKYDQNQAKKYHGNNSKYYLVEVAENMANGSGKMSGKCRDVCTEENNIKILGLNDILTTEPGSTIVALINDK